MNTNEEIKKQLTSAAKQVLEEAKLKKGDIIVVGCSSSEIGGDRLGTNSSPETGELVYKTLSDIFTPRGIYIAAQCCEHLNRAIIIEREAARDFEQVNVVPFPKAGGSFATAAYKYMNSPVAIEAVKADAGIDIGGVMIGMHLKTVAVPIKLKERFVGNALILAARVRPKFIGGERAHYDDELR